MMLSISTLFLLLGLKVYRIYHGRILVVFFVSIVQYRNGQAPVWSRIQQKVMNAVEVLHEPGEEVTGAVIFLHGAGFSGNVTKAHMEELLEGPLADMPFPSYIKVYFPTAPERYIKIRDKVMTCWFDGERVGERVEDIHVNYKDCDEASERLIQLIEEIEATGIPRKRIALAGLSQGGMLAQYVAFSKMKELAGVLTIASAYIFAKAKILEPPLPPLTQLHGLKDPIIPIKGVRMAETLLRSQGVVSTLRTLPDSTHELDGHYLKLFIIWAQKVIPPL